MVEKGWQQAGRQDTRCIHLQESDKENKKIGKTISTQKWISVIFFLYQSSTLKDFIWFQIVALAVNQVLIYRQQDISHSTYSCELNNLYYYPYFINQDVSMTWNLFIYEPQGYLCLCFICEGTTSMKYHIQYFTCLFWGQKSFSSEVSALVTEKPPLSISLKVTDHMHQLHWIWFSQNYAINDCLDHKKWSSQINFREPVFSIMWIKSYLNVNTDT